MAESKMALSFPNRRLQNRFALPANSQATLRFSYPPPNGPGIEARMRDISLSGLSLTLPAGLEAIQVGDIVKGIDAQVEMKTFRGDLLVMHVTPANRPGAICGGLFYPEGDEDLITIRLVIRALEAASNA